MRTKPDFYYQKILSKDGKLLGVEVLSRDFPIFPETDVHVFYSILEELSDWKPPFQVHVNVFYSTIRFVNWEEVRREFGDSLVIELVESRMTGSVRDLELLFRDGIRVALDDFGSGFSNFYLVNSFPFHYVKVDAQYTSPKIAKLLKDEYGVRFLIAEKAVDYPADAFQAFVLHYPERLTEEAKVALIEEAEKTESFSQRP